MTSFLATTKPTAREEVLADLMARLCPGALISGQEVTSPTGFGDPLRTAVRFKVAHFVMRAGGPEFFSPQLARSPDLTEIAAYENRRQAFFSPTSTATPPRFACNSPPGVSSRRFPPTGASRGLGFSRPRTTKWCGKRTAMSLSCDAPSPSPGARYPSRNTLLYANFSRPWRKRMPAR